MYNFFCNDFFIRWFFWKTTTTIIDNVLKNKKKVYKNYNKRLKIKYVYNITIHFILEVSRKLRVSIKSE